mmetsp:Transcript_34310/g.86101  ORF Transcript_34310/g.86101 Transcript_34310/m.86101 type:complete len:111 (+) Transcript_34310:23-355(+)
MSKQRPQASSKSIRVGRWGVRACMCGDVVKERQVLGDPIFLLGSPALPHVLSYRTIGVLAARARMRVMHLHVCTYTCVRMCVRVSVCVCGSTMPALPPSQAGLADGAACQ